MQVAIIAGPYVLLAAAAVWFYIHERRRQNTEYEQEPEDAFTSVVGKLADRLKSIEESLAVALGPEPEPPDPPMPVASSEHVDKFMENLNKDSNTSVRISLGIDALLAEQRQFRKSFDSWMKAMFGDGTRGYTEMTDEEAVLREDAAALVQRYGLTYEEAVARAKAASVYKTQGGMGGRA